MAQALLFLRGVLCPAVERIGCIGWNDGSYRLTRPSYKSELGHAAIEFSQKTYIINSYVFIIFFFSLSGS